ncbi:hypothetical protein [Lactobacillus yonginensis]
MRTMYRASNQQIVPRVGGLSWGNYPCLERGQSLKRTILVRFKVALKTDYQASGLPHGALTAGCW